MKTYFGTVNNVLPNRLEMEWDVDNSKILGLYETLLFTDRKVKTKLIGTGYNVLEDIFSIFVEDSKGIVSGDKVLISIDRDPDLDDEIKRQFGMKTKGDK